MIEAVVKPIFGILLRKYGLARGIAMVFGVTSS
jgi:hypothetical protein